MNTPPTTPAAHEISVAETLELLNGPFRPVARGVADDQYAFWLGSGISRERLPGVRELILKVLAFLQAHAAAEGPGGPHGKALEDALEKANLRPGERTAIQLDESPEFWPVKDAVLDGLQNQYAEFLDIRVDEQPPDYLVWEAVDVRDTYGTAIDPDCEHVCIGILALEGAVTEVASPNWDGLLEGALAELTGGSTSVQVVVLPEDLRAHSCPLTLLKFHGCAVCAVQDQDRYRPTIVATKSQISDWTSSQDVKPIRDKIVLLATTKPTLMIGLSAQDENIQQVFAHAKNSMEWAWPNDPPAHVFAADEIGSHHGNLLRVVYREAYDQQPGDIEQQALLRAYGKPLLTALVLFVLAEKLRAYLAAVDAPDMPPADAEELAQGLTALGQRLATHAEPDRLHFVRALVAAQHRTLALFQEGREEPSGAGVYKPLSGLPVHRVNEDPALSTNGVRELAAALALLGRGETESTWSLSTGAVGSGANGVVKVMSSGSEAAVFFAANGKAAVRLATEGVIDPGASDVVILHSTEPVKAMHRSPSAAYGRTGKGGVREVDMCELLRTSPDLAAVEEAFRLEAAL